MAKTTIGALNVKLSANTAAFSRGLGRAKKQSSMFTQAMKRSVAAVAVLGTAAASAAVFGLQRLTRAQLDVIDSAGKLSDITGTTTESIAGFRLAAKLAGSSTEGADKALKNFVRRIGEAKTGTGEAIRGLDMLGLSADKLGSMDAVDAFAAVSEEIRKLPQAADRASAAYFILGRSGAELGSLILGGADAIEQARQQALAFGTAVSGKSAKQVEAANDSLTILEEVFSGIGATIAVEVAPLILAIAKRFTDAAANGESFGSKVVKAFNAVLTYVKLFADGVQIVGQVVIKVQSAILSAFEKTGRAALELTSVLNRLDPTSATDALMDLQKQSLDMLASMRAGVDSTESFFDGSAFSVRIARTIRSVRTEADGIASAMMAATKASGDFGDQIERAADAAEMGTATGGGSQAAGAGSFRQVSLGRTALSTRNPAYDLMMLIARHTGIIANNSRYMGVN